MTAEPVRDGLGAVFALQAPDGLIATPRLLDSSSR
jgi:hypothetical protein